MTRSLTGLAPNHSLVTKPEHGVNRNSNENQHVATEERENDQPEAKRENLEAHLPMISILKRHTMCDCLILVKHYRENLQCYTLEFPRSSPLNKPPTSKSNLENLDTRLIFTYVDEADPLNCCLEKSKLPEGELVYVPMNGLLERLELYAKHGVVIDSVVHAFALGIKTSEKFLVTTNTIKEVQETPPI